MLEEAEDTKTGFTFITSRNVSTVIVTGLGMYALNLLSRRRSSIPLGRRTSIFVVPSSQRKKNSRVKVFKKEDFAKFTGRRSC